MCTSFAVYAPLPVYGMNFDYPDVALNLQMVVDEVGAVFYLRFEHDGVWARVAGMNEQGLFAAAQIMRPDYEIIPQSPDVPVSPYEVFAGALCQSQRVGEVVTRIGQRRLAYLTPRKGHQLYADRYGGTLIVEPGRTGNVLTHAQGTPAVMTNFPVWEAQDSALADVRGPGSERYRTACEYIAQHDDRFGFEDGREVLQRTALTVGLFTTQCSLVCAPEHKAVYVMLRRDFGRVWRVDLAQRTLEACGGFGARHAFALDGDGINAADLAGCT